MPAGAGMKILWDDGHPSQWSARDLRIQCRCAACRHELTGEQLLKPEAVSQDITIQKADIVGRYALGFHFSDGHNSGIYTFDALRKECPCCRQKKES